MAKCNFKLPEDFLKRLFSLGERTDEVAKKALEAGGQIILAKARSNLIGVIGKDTKGQSRSTGQLVSSLGLSPVRLDRNGNYNIKIGFDEYRRDGSSNAGVANILEYGKHGQPAKPFLTPAKKQAGKQALEEMKRIIEEETRK
ncbi:MAG: HK97 gp10 family phage protein [Bacilli bacterium]|nr:HK97 gp10 family phage protein [Bacilli bacterium]